MISIQKTIFIFFLLTITIRLNAQSDASDDENLSCKSRTLRAFYAEYDGHLGPEPVREAKFNDYIDCFDPGMSKAERHQAFLIADAYIRGDGSALLNEEKKSELNRQLYQIFSKFRNDSARAVQYVDNYTARLKQMSYDEYAAYLRNTDEKLSEREIALSYNQLHRNDGKSVFVPAENPGEMTAAKAYKIIADMKHYDFNTVLRAFRFMDPNVKEEEVRLIWESERKQHD